MKYIMKKFLFTPFVLAAFFIGCGDNDQTAEQEEPAVPVHVYKLQPETLARHIQLTGSVTATEDAVVYAKVPERLERLNVRVGDRVSRNQIIAVQYSAISAQALLAAQAAAANAEAQLQLARTEFERMERLHKQRAVSNQQLQQISTQLKAAEAANAASLAQVSQAKEQLANSNASAPFNGIVSAIFVEENQMLQAGQPIAQVINPTSMKAKPRISGKDISRIKQGQIVNVVIPSLDNKNYNGKISNINRSLDPVSKTLEVEITFSNADQNLRSGMYGEFYVATDSVINTIVIPENALLSQTEVRINRETGVQETIKKYFVLIVEAGKAVSKEVTVGLPGDGRIEILTGLNYGDNVIVTGNNIVRNGQPVNIID